VEGTKIVKFGIQLRFLNLPITEKHKPIGRGAQTE